MPGMVRGLVRVGLAVLLVGWVCPVVAAPPWQRLVVFRRVEANPRAEYRLSEEHGPWLILAKTFLGEKAEAKAAELVLELRTRFKLEAFTHPLEFDYTGEVEGRGVDQFGAPKKMRYSRQVEGQEIGVLVGQFTTVDSSEAQKTLERIKYARPRCLEIDAGDEAASPLEGLRRMQQMVLADGNPKKLKGPMGHAFLVTNPLLPREYYVPQGPDPLVLEMNRDVEHSLLDCPGRYTVKVATFTGRVVVDQKKIRELESQGDAPSTESRLAEAAEQAHRLTLALRKQGVEAYEFHDRYSSLVTVGSFHAVGTPRQDGKIEINPEIHALLKKYGAGPDSAVPGARGMIKTKSLAGIPFDAQPMPVEVPKKLLSTSYEQPTGWTRR